MSEKCTLCPRNCGADRSSGVGYCHAPSELTVARAALHRFEEPVISGNNGSGTIFFCGCNLGCVYCQNRAVSRGFDREKTAAKIISEEDLARIMLRLRDEGAHNINLVTPTHYADRIGNVLGRIKNELGIPVVYNCGGYESVGTLKNLEGLIDIYMPDFKYFSSELSAKYSSAPDYAERASAALAEMYRQTGEFSLGDDGLMKKGILLRHLVLPGGRRDSSDVLKLVSETVDPGKILISIMRQYTPDFAPEEMKELRRRITSFEYDFVISESEKYGFVGFSQDKESAQTSYTPDFKLKTF